MFVVSAAGIYLLNVLLALAYGWSVAHWALPVRIAAVSVPVTALMTWLVMPRAARLLQSWLYAPDRRI
jgi:antibiotic biosynthesis monooxygenase (ABM) superfamily enzyme